METPYLQIKQSLRGARTATHSCSAYVYQYSLHALSPSFTETLDFLFAVFLST